MSCGGGMLRTSHQPLAHLVDQAAERWLAVEHRATDERRAASADITDSFNIGDNERMTFHGLRYLLTVINTGPARPYRIEIHAIARE